MPRPVGPSRNTPAYCFHKSSNRAFVTIDGKMVYLGRYGTPESRQRYDVVIGEWLANGRRLPAPANPANPTTISMMLAAFLRHAQEYHRNADGTPARELDNYKDAIRPVHRLYGSTVVAEFTPVCMKNVRGEMVRMGWARTNINRQLCRVRHVFNWAAGEGNMIPASIADAVAKVRGLRFGKSEARESDPVEPVSDEHFRATLPHLPSRVRSMVELQILTGMRPGEICMMRNRDIDAPKDGIWHYSPTEHKTRHHGIRRSIPLGPKAREIIAPYMKLDPDAFIFSPADSEADRHAQQREDRQTRVQPSQVKRAAESRRRKKRRGPGVRYTVHSYRRAVARACDLTFPPPGELAQRDEESAAKWKTRLTPEQRKELAEWEAEHSWSPNQLRHSAATLIRELYGIEAAQALLGHKHTKTTEIYAARNLKAAEKVMAEVG